MQSLPLILRVCLLFTCFLPPISAGGATITHGDGIKYVEGVSNWLQQMFSIRPITTVSAGMFILLFSLFFLLKKKRRKLGWVPGDRARSVLRMVPWIAWFIVVMWFLPARVLSGDFVGLSIVVLSVVLVWEFLLHRWIFQPVLTRNPVGLGTTSQSVDFEITSEAVNESALPSDDKLFEKVWAEIEAGKIEQGLWARLWVGNSGDEVKTKAAYLKARVDQIKTEPTKPLVSLGTDEASSPEFTVHAGGHIVPKIADPISEDDKVTITDATDRAVASEINQASSSNFTVHYGGHVVPLIGQPPNTKEEKSV